MSTDTPPPLNEERPIQWLHELGWGAHGREAHVVAQTTSGCTECVCQLAYFAMSCESEADRIAIRMRQHKEEKLKSETPDLTFFDVLQAFARELPHRFAILFIEQKGGGLVTSVKLLRSLDGAQGKLAPRTLARVADARRAFCDSENIATVVVDAEFSKTVKYVPPRDANGLVKSLKLNDNDSENESKVYITNTPSPKTTLAPDTVDILRRARKTIVKPHMNSI